MLPSPFAMTAMKNLLFAMLGLLMLSATGTPAMAEQRGGPNFVGDRPETPTELRNSDNSCGAQQRPFAW